MASSSNHDSTESSVAFGALLDRLRELGLPAGDYAIFGSGPLAVRGIVEAPGDLDVLCRGRAWDQVCDLAPLRTVEPWGVELVELDAGRLSFGKRWAIGSFDEDELIETAEILAGLPFVRLWHVIEYKTLSGRAKDQRHLEALRNHHEYHRSDAHD